MILILGSAKRGALVPFVPIKWVPYLQLEAFVDSSPTHVLSAHGPLSRFNNYFFGLLLIPLFCIGQLVAGLRNGNHISSYCPCLRSVCCDSGCLLILVIRCSDCDSY